MESLSQLYDQYLATAPQRNYLRLSNWERHVIRKLVEFGF